MIIWRPRGREAKCFFSVFRGVLREELVRPKALDEGLWKIRAQPGICDKLFFGHGGNEWNVEVYVEGVKQYKQCGELSIRGFRLLKAEACTSSPCIHSGLNREMYSSLLLASDNLEQSLAVQKEIGKLISVGLESGMRGYHVSFLSIYR